MAKDWLTVISRNDAIREQNPPRHKCDNWISVKDRLPEWGEIITSSKFGFVTALFYDKIVGFWDGETKDNYWNRCVTHWMPLPNPPKTEE